MNRKQNTWLIAGICAVIIVGGLGGFFVYKFAPAHWNFEPVEIEFPIHVDYVDNITKIRGYGIMDDQSFHNGIDFGPNCSVELIACCDLRITDVKTWFDEERGTGQTSIIGKFNWKYRFDIGVESWASNETDMNLQREALNVTVGQTIQKGESLGFLLYHGEYAHIHFGLKEGGKEVCPYQFMSVEARSIVDVIWAAHGEEYGGGNDDVCGE